MKAIVIFRSKTGFVKRYAEWIAQDLSCKAICADDFDMLELKIYDTIVYGGGLYAVGINGLKAFRKHLLDLKGKRIAIFATGASPWRKEVVDEVRDKNLTEEEQRMVGFFYLRGGFDYEKLGAKDRLLMTLMKKRLESKKDLDEDERGLLASYDQPVDFVRRENIADLVQYLK